MARRPKDELNRVERMITWLRVNQAKIAKSDKGKITFDYAGPNLVARLESIEQIEKTKI